MSTTETAGSVVRFFTQTVETGLDVGLITHDDVLRHVTPELIALHLPKPLLAKLLTVCLASPRMDAKLVVDVISVRELCTHIPAQVIWACLAEAAQRALGGVAVPLATVASTPITSSAAATAPAASAASPIPAPIPPPSNHAASTSTAIPVAVAPAGSEPAPLGAPPAGPKLRSTQTIPAVKPVTTSPTVRASTSPLGSSSGSSSGSSGASTGSATKPSLTTPNTVRRPQASGASAPSPAAGTPPAGNALGGAARPRTSPPVARRATTNSDFEIDTDVGANAGGSGTSGTAGTAGTPPAAQPEWKARTEAEALEALGVSDDDIVDWAQAEETITAGVDLERKR